MARNFTITTPAETVRVGPDGRAEILFTVTNVSGIPNRGLARLSPMGNTNREWLTLTDVEREFPIGGVQQYRVAANIPPGTAAGRYTWRFDVGSALKGGESSDAGPTVAFEVPATGPEKKGIPWWVWVAIAVAALVAGVIAFLVWQGRDSPEAVVKTGFGRTTPGSTAWQPYDGGTTGIFVDVDTSSAGFSAAPLYFTSIGGDSSHWATTGATSIYLPTATGFRVYVRWADGRPITPAEANGYQWHINWSGIQP